MKWKAELYRIVIVAGHVPRYYILTRERWEELWIPNEELVDWLDNKSFLAKEVKPRVIYEYWIGEPDPVLGEEEKELFEKFEDSGKDMNVRFDGKRDPRYKMPKLPKGKE